MSCLEDGERERRNLTRLLEEAREGLKREQEERERERNEREKRGPEERSSGARGQGAKGGRRSNDSSVVSRVSGGGEEV